MKVEFHKLRIKKLNRETADCVSVTLDVPDHLRDEFVFTQGQHLIFKTTHDGEEIRRSYSICSCPLDNDLRVAVKKIDGGVFSTYINEHAKEGDEVEVMSPQGNFFTTLNSEHRKHYLAVAAGSGITPVISIIKTVLRSEPHSRVTLLFGNRNKSSIIFKEEIEALKNLYMDRFSLYHILSREKTDAKILSGRIDAAKITYFLNNLITPQRIDEVFLCGPEEMIFASRDSLVEAGVNVNQIHFELFYSATAEAKRIEREQDRTTDTSALSRVSLKLDGTTLEFDLSYQGDSVLDAALKNGADLPYSCKGGVCATCKCKLEEGEVMMDVNYALEPDELENGFILACQSHPISEKLVVNFDIK